MLADSKKQEKLKKSTRQVIESFVAREPGREPLNVETSVSIDVDDLELEELEKARGD